MTHPGELADYERFPALRELLRSYASTGYNFTDTPEEPSQALLAYARLAVKTPDRLTMAISEIDEILRVGLFSDEVADDVETLPHIRPPAGASVEQCLRIVRGHLAKIASGELPIDVSVPQTRWEWNANYPELGQFFGCYFNQDFSQDYASRQEALDQYIAESDEETLRQAYREITDLLVLVTSDDVLRNATDSLGLEVLPPRGATLRQWLTDMSAIVAQRLQG